MFKRLLSGASVHTIAIPVAISILASVGFKALQIHGTWTLEYIDVSLAFVALGVLAGLVVMALNFDERLGELSRSIDSIARQMKDSGHKDNIQDVISRIGAISHEISTDVKRLDQDGLVEKLLRRPATVSLGRDCSKDAEIRTEESPGASSLFEAGRPNIDSYDKYDNNRVN